MSKLNWRQILLHGVAFWFFVHAFKTLSYLYNAKLVDAVKYSDSPLTPEALSNSGTSTTDLADFLFWTSISGFIGLLAALLITLAISFRRKWFWMNAIVAFFLVYILYRFNVLGWEYVKSVFLYPGKLFSSTTIELLVNGIVLLVIGLLFIFLLQPGQTASKHTESV